jgi:hypothetical protein
MFFFFIFFSFLSSIPVLFFLFVPFILLSFCSFHSSFFLFLSFFFLFLLFLSFFFPFPSVRTVLSFCSLHSFSFSFFSTKIVFFLLLSWLHGGGRESCQAQGPVVGLLDELDPGVDENSVKKEQNVTLVAIWRICGLWGSLRSRTQAAMRGREGNTSPMLSPARLLLAPQGPQLLPVSGSGNFALLAQHPGPA